MHHEQAGSVTSNGFKVAFAKYGHTAMLDEFLSLPDGMKLSRVDVNPIVGAYRRMIRGLEFDISELAPFTYMIARTNGVPIKAIPVFLSRGFHYADTICRSDSGIETPKDLEGKSFGVRAYTVTTGVWVRGVLAERFGVDLSKIEWVVDDEDHVLGLDLPSNVRKLPQGGSIADAFARGEVQAALRGIAGVGRKGSPLESWSASDVAVTDGFSYRELIGDPVTAARADYKETGVYPMHRTVVIKDEVAERYPDLPRMLFDAFEAAKDAYISSLASRPPNTAEDKKHIALMDIVGGDPLPYGLENNRPTIDKLAKYGVEQGLVADNVEGASLFYDFDP